MATAPVKTSRKEPVWDVVVIGGGPAGMMAAGRAAERGAKVLLLEKNETLGKKLLITGGGRCNVTNAEQNARKLLEKFKDSNKYLFSAFSKWSVKETLDFFNGRGMETKVEALQRVFPTSDRAQSVWNVLVEYMKEGKVTVRSNSEVIGFEHENTGEENLTENNKAASGKITAVKIAVVGKTKTIVKGKQFILATGGKSHPETGSTGQGFEWLKEMGHTIIEQDAALVPIALKDEWPKHLQGITIKDVKISLFQNNVKQHTAAPAGGTTKGRILFTHFGVSGPTILNMSRDISELLKYGEVVISLDLLPELDYGKLNLKLQEILKEHTNKKFRNSLSELVPSAIVPVIVGLSKIDPETWCHSVTRGQRLALVQLMKAIPLNVKGLLGVNKAVITSGGVKLGEIDFKTMRSRLYPNLFLIGDILHIDRPSGGYSLQLCWTTGFVAGDSVSL